MMSGKGGVGKTTIATDIALELGAGLLDVDVMAPNAPTLIGGELKRPMSATDQGIIPAVQNGIEVVSLHYDLPEDTVYAKSGEFKYKQLREYIHHTQWQSDMVVIDHPPGTGTESRTVLSMLPQSKAIVVSTGREVSVQDCRRSLKMLLNADVDILGVIENMSYYKPPEWVEKLIDQADEEDLPDNTRLPLLGDDAVEDKFGFGEPYNYQAPIIGSIPFMNDDKKRRVLTGEIIRNLVESV